MQGNIDCREMLGMSVLLETLRRGVKDGPDVRMRGRPKFGRSSIPEPTCDENRCTRLCWTSEPELASNGADARPYTSLVRPILAEFGATPPPLHTSGPLFRPLPPLVDTK